MDPWAAALLVVFSLMMTTIGVVTMVAAHLGRLGRHLMARGLTALLYGAWALLVGGILVSLTELDISILQVGGNNRRHRPADAVGLQVGGGGSLGPAQLAIARPAHV